MEPTPKGRAKLQLKKQAVSNLSKAEQAVVKGGKEQEAAWTTSIGHCSGFTCCGHTDTCGTQLCTVSVCLSLLTTL